MWRRSRTDLNLPQVKSWSPSWVLPLTSGGSSQSMPTQATLNKYRNKKKIELRMEEKKKIQEIEELFLTQPIRSYPYNMEKPFILDTDYSRMAAGGVLALVQGEQEGFIACF